ncbi:MAG TPA: histidine kinase dimerization/phospho-acceptor domain-containing protein [Candidatus Binataceae bacterium]|nr:histidine kinase dimerization/phospho-acceptor domain-containing protein [Candidatus Binataceae bacterium]
MARQARAAQRVRAAGSWNRGLRLEPLAKLAHELRTPIQVLLGYLDILRGELADTVGRRPQEIIERMNINAHDLAQTIENLMDFASASMDAEWRR